MGLIGRDYSAGLRDKLGAETQDWVHEWQAAEEAVGAVRD